MPGSRRRRVALLVVLLAAVVVAIVMILDRSRRAVSPTAQIEKPETAPGSHEAGGEASVEPAAAEAPPEDAADDILDSVLDGIDLVAYMEEGRRARFEKAKEELREKLVVKWEMRDIPGRSQPVRVRVESVSLEEQIRLYEEFLAKFPLSTDTHGQAHQLARLYHRAGRIDDARRMYDDIVAVLPDRFFPTKQRLHLDRARMEAGAGNFGAAEDILRRVIDEPTPQRYPGTIGDLRHDWTEITRNFEAPLQLADVYRRAGRPRDAENVLIQIADYAFAVPREHQQYGSIISFAGRAYQQRIDILFDAGTADELDEVAGAADALIEEYRRGFEGRDSRLPEYMKHYVERHVDRMRRDVERRTKRIRQVPSGYEP